MTAALALLHDCLTPAGFVASPVARANYRRVWARDGVVCGLAGLAADDDALADGLARTLETLAAHVGPQGQVPSNVSIGDDGEDEVSYGGLAGRVDTGAWFALGLAALADAGRPLPHLVPAAERVLALMDAWEVNARGLVYAPQSGDWADEYVLHGYTLYVQALRVAALRALAPHASDPDAMAARAGALARLVEATFWPAPGADADAAYHPAAFRVALAEGVAPGPFAALTPGGYVRRFDGFGTAVALGLAGLWRDRAGEALDAGQALAAARPDGLVPAFWPPVVPGDADWPALTANVRDAFSNAPGHYHNGGGWPVVGGFWGLALARAGRADEARALADRLDALGEAHAFPEYLDADAGAPHGTPRLGWSAAGAVLARHGLRLLAPARTPASEAPVLAGPAAGAVIVAGEVLIDLISAVPTDSLGEAGAFERHAGGSAANCATNLARLGVPTVLVATVGADGFGRFLADEAARTGVALRLRTAEGTPTSVAAVTRSRETPDFALYRHADRMLLPDQLPDALLGGARLFHTSGFALSREPARTTLLDAAARAAARGTALSVDLNVAPRTPWERTEALATARAFLALGPIVKLSRDDAARLFGEDRPDADVTDALLGWGARLVCLTCGADGAVVATPEARVAVPAAPVAHVADATGAGDAFWAGFLAAWLGGQPPAACAEAGGHLAALKLSRPGPLPPHVDPAVLRLAA